MLQLSANCFLFRQRRKNRTHENNQDLIIFRFCILFWISALEKAEVIEFTPFYFNKMNTSSNGLSVGQSRVGWVE